MCCIAEIAMFVFGITTLVKGSFTLSHKRVVRGAPAYVIGAILISVIPAVFFIAFVMGAVIAARAGGQPPTPEQLSPLAAVDALVVLAALIAVLAIAFAAGKEPAKKRVAAPLGPLPNPTFKPADPNNPYASPQADDRDRLLDDLSGQR